jgi:hypothetical protein
MEKNRGLLLFSLVDLESVSDSNLGSLDDDLDEEE